MRLQRCFFALCLVCASRSGAQTLSPEQAQKDFAEAKALCAADAGKLWGVSLCGPILFVDPETRAIVANQADAKGALTAQGGVFVGSLPKSENFANTATEWSGTLWTEMAWPLPDDRSRRDTLMLHELYHRIQPQLKVPLQHNVGNAQLDTFDGRYTLLLEYRALARALSATSEWERRSAITDALIFRADRYKTFASAAEEEKSLEFNEGLAEYTGVRLGNPLDADATAAVLRDLSNQAKVPTLVRSFAYGSGPAYGLLLDRYRPEWRTALPDAGSLSEMLQAALKLTLPKDLAKATEQRSVQYDGVALRATETERESKRKETLAANRAKFVTGPTLTIPMKQMSVQFDPRTLQPLDDLGTIYPEIRVSDVWGILEASKGAMIDKDWSSVIVAAPTETTGTKLKGDGWTLELTAGWKLAPGARKGDFVLQAAP